MLDSVLVWFRRDLRIDDQMALAEALRRARLVHCAFIFDREILDALPNRSDRRVAFIHASLVELDNALGQHGGGLVVRYGIASDEIPRLANKLGVSAVFTNRDYELQSKRRDEKVSAALAVLGIGFESFKDQVIFDGAEVLTLAGKPYTVFTPYKNAWLKRLTDDDLSPHILPSGSNPRPLHFAATSREERIPDLEELGFTPTDLVPLGVEPGLSGARKLLERFAEDGNLHRYAEQRDFPAVDGCSRLSVHLRFGTVSIRKLVTTALQHGAHRDDKGAATWLSELIWRDFYFMILDHFPHVGEQAFKREYDAIEWETGDLAEERFAAWCAGRTGFPLVDAAMRQLNTTGYMHNRLRMLVASFLTKDLGLDWRRGEAYFAVRLIDFDLAANNGGWQWAASSGCDAQPYFRIFNPVTQSTRFDPDGHFIRRFVPELSPLTGGLIHSPWQMNLQQQSAFGVTIGRTYPGPIVDHAEARKRTLARYAVVKRCAGE